MRRTRVFQTRYLLLAIALAAFSCAAMACAAGNGGRPTVPTASGATIPTHSRAQTITLNSGKVRKVGWKVLASVGKGEKGADRPCLTQIDKLLGQTTERTRCGSLPSHFGWPVATQFTAGFSEPGGRRVGATVLAMAFEPSIARVGLHLVPGPKLVRDTRVLSEAQASRAGLHPFSYIAFGIPRKVCVAHVVGYRRDGSRVFYSETRWCREHEEGEIEEKGTQ